MKSIHILGGVSLFSLVACSATMPPKELVDARTQYQMSAQGPAAAQTPAELHAAKTALDQAEADFKDKGDKPIVQDEAYIALRKVQLADAQAQLLIAQKQKAQNDANAQAMTQNQLKATSAALSATQTQLSESEMKRQEAEKRAKMAMDDLAKIASVKQEQRGMVITLSGAVLFATDKSALLPDAITKLNDVADALIKGNPDANIVIEGHTDSQGNHEYNMNLSQKRADAVKAQLVARGVASDRITTRGVGPDQPIADNKSAEGRANNRRVEIIVSPSTPVSHPLNGPSSTQPRP